MTDDFKPYQDAYDAFKKDIEQLTGIGSRLITNAESVQNESITPAAKLEKLKTVNAQVDKLPQAFKDAENKYNAAIDAADEAWVNRFEGICSYAMASGQGDAGTQYLLEECKAYSRAKGDYKLRRALWRSIGDIADSVASAIEGRKDAASGSSIIDEFESITDPEARTRFHSKNRDQLLAAYDARNQNTQSETQNASN